MTATGPGRFTLNVALQQNIWVRREEKEAAGGPGGPGGGTFGRGPGVVDLGRGWRRSGDRGGACLAERPPTIVII